MSIHVLIRMGRRCSVWHPIHTNSSSLDGLNVPISPTSSTPIFDLPEPDNLTSTTMHSTTSSPTTLPSTRTQKDYMTAFGELQTLHGLAGAPTMSTPTTNTGCSSSSSGSNSIKPTASSAFTRMFNFRSNKSSYSSESSSSLHSISTASNSDTATYCASSDTLVHTRIEKPKKTEKKDYEAALAQMQTVQGFVGAPIVFI
jgi:hypothetical protein